MKKILFPFFAILSLAFLSCASAPIKNIYHYPEIDLDDLSSDKYEILGEITEDAKITVKKSDLNNEQKNLNSPELALTYIPAIGDNGNYGFIDKDSEKYLTLFDRALALAEFKLIEVAEYNHADALTCVRSNVKAVEINSQIVIAAYVTAYAVKLTVPSKNKIERPIYVLSTSKNDSTSAEKSNQKSKKQTEEVEEEADDDTQEDEAYEETDESEAGIIEENE